MAIAVTAASCASSPPPSCRAGERLAVMEVLYFGTARPAGVVTPQEWAGFVNEVITPRFPQGLTSWDASGQWQGASGVIERESSHVLHVVHPDAEQDELAVQQIVGQYRTRFQQEAVLRVRSNVCMSL